MANQPTTRTPALPDDRTALLPAPGGWTTTDDLLRSTDRSRDDLELLLRAAALDGLLVDGALLGGGPGTWHRPSRTTLTDHRVVRGRTGSGKTTALRAFLATEHAAGDVASWVGDPGGHLENDPAAPRERYAAGHQAVIELLTEARQLISHRSTTSPIRPGLAGPLLAVDGPLVVVTVDDAYLLLMEDPQAVYLLEGIALLGPPLGVVPRIATVLNNFIDLGSQLLWRTLNHPA